MYNTCVTSSISLRTRGTFSFALNDYAHCLNERHPFACSYSRTCCANYICKVPVSSSYCCNLYGLRQSSLIHRSPYRKLISGGLDRLYFARLPFCDVDDSCYCDEVFSSRKISVGGTKGGLRKCMVFEERSEGYDAGGFDEAEDLLSLLTEDISEECFLATKEIIRLREKPVVEKPGNAEVGKKCGSKKKRFDPHVLESEPRYGYGSVSSSKNDNRRREEIIRRKEEKEGLLRKENKKGISEEKHKDAWLTNQTAREKEEKEALLRKVGQKDRGKREREFNWNLTSKTEDREDLLRREEHRQKVSKDASSCSSYYSFSSAGDYESENDTELRKGRYLGESLRSHKRNSKSNEMVYQEAREEDHKHEDYRDHGVILTKKSTENDYSVRSSFVESDFKKKSEKKLADVTVQEMESRGEALQKESKLSMAHESNYKKSSDYYVSYDDRKAKSSGRTKYDEERKQQQRQTGNEIPQQTETRMKHKQFVEMPDSPGGDVINSYGSQNIYSGKGEMTAKVASSSQATVGERQRVVGLSTREDEYQRNSHIFAKLSEIQDIDIRKTSISQQRFESSVKEEDYSANILSSINDAAKQQQCDHISGQVESSGKSQQLTKKAGNSLLKRPADELIKQEENVNLGYGSSSQPKIIKSDISKEVYNELTKTSLTHAGDSGAIDVEGRKKTQSDTAGALSPRLNVGIATNEVSDGILQIGSTSVHEHNLEGSKSLRHETYGRANSSSSHGQHSKFISHEDAIRSAAQLEKSSTQHIGEYFDQRRNEISSSEILREKRTNETRFVHEEQHHQHNLVQHRSEDSQSKEHESRSDGQHSGAKGPSDEMWNVEEPSVQELSRTEVQDDANKDGKSIVKRSGGSLWNIISDIVLLRWAPHSGSHSSGGKTGGRSSPNQSTSSEAWFSGHEAVESEEVTEEKAQRSILQVATEEKEQRSITQGLSESNQAGKIRSQIEEGSSSSTFRGQLKQEGINVPSSSDVLQSQPIRTSLHSGGLISEGNFGGTSTSATPESSISLPAFQLQRSPAGIGVSKAGEVSASDSGMSEQLNTGLIVKKEPAVNEGKLKQRKFQRQDQVIKDRFDDWENAYRLEAEQQKIDEKFMREALLEAQKAADNWEVPVGAVLVHNRKIIARGCNLVEEMRDSTAHAEMICIKEASNMLQTWRLSETTLYVTLEPCPMCAGAILQARIDTVVWGAPNKLLGADGSWIRLFPNGDGGNGLELTDKPAAPVHPFHPNITIRRGVLSSECTDAMQQFFKLRRKKDKKPERRPSPPSCLPITHRPSKFLAKMHDAFNFMFCL